MITKTHGYDNTSTWLLFFFCRMCQLLKLVGCAAHPTKITLGCPIDFGRMCTPFWLDVQAVFVGRAACPFPRYANEADSPLHSPLQENTHLTTEGKVAAGSVCFTTLKSSGGAQGRKNNVRRYLSSNTGHWGLVVQRNILFLIY